jgi:hypothetical protein
MPPIMLSGEIHPDKPAAVCRPTATRTIPSGTATTRFGGPGSVLPRQAHPPLLRMFQNPQLFSFVSRSAVVQRVGECAAEHSQRRHLPRAALRWPPIRRGDTEVPSFTSSAAGLPRFLPTRPIVVWRGSSTVPLSRSLAFHMHHESWFPFRSN